MILTRLQRPAAAAPPAAAAAAQSSAAAAHAVASAGLGSDRSGGLLVDAGRRRRELVGVLPTSSAGHDEPREAVLVYDNKTRGAARTRQLVLNRSSSATTSTIILTDHGDDDKRWCLVLSARRHPESGQTALYFPAQHELIGDGGCHAHPPLQCDNETQLFELRAAGRRKQSIHAVYADGTRSSAIEVHPATSRLTVATEAPNESQRLFLKLPAKTTERGESSSSSSYVLPVVAGSFIAVVALLLMMWRRRTLQQ